MEMGITTFSQNKWGGRSDWSRPSITSTTTTTTTTTTENTQQESKISQPRFSAFGKASKFTSVKPIQETNEQVNTIATPTTPRFSVFGKKAKFESINQKSLEQDKKPQQQSSRHINKFELHLSNKSVANNKQQQDDLTTCSIKKRRQGVTFDPLFLERVCLFREAQCPLELREAHDKRLLNPPFRIICPNWPPQQTSDYQRNILLNKKTFSVQPDNTCIKGKLMVRNLALDKSVSIRYTFDSWTTVRDVDGVFFGPNPKNIAFDIYEFVIDLGFGQISDRGELRAKIEFAIRFTAGDKDYCDNNNGRNYQIKLICDPLNDPWADEKKKEKPKSSVEDEDEYPDEEQEEEEEEDEDLLLEEDEQEKHNSFTNALKGYKHARPFHLNKRQPWLGTRYDFGQSLSLAKRAPYESWTTSVKTDPTSITDYFLVKPITIKPTTPITAGPVEQTPTPSSSTTTTTTSKPSSFTITKSQSSSSLVSFNNYPQMTTTTSTPTTNSTAISAPSYSKPTFMFSSASAPPSPRVSPTLSAASPTRPSLHSLSHSTSAAIPTLTTSASPLDINSSYYLELVNKYCFYSSTSDLTNNNEDTQQQQQQLSPISSI